MTNLRAGHIRVVVRAVDARLVVPQLREVGGVNGHVDRLKLRDALVDVALLHDVAMLDPWPKHISIEGGTSPGRHVRDVSLDLAVVFTLLRVEHLQKSSAVAVALAATALWISDPLKLCNREE